MLLWVSGIPIDTPTPKTAPNRLRAPPRMRTKRKLPQPERHPHPGRARPQRFFSSSTAGAKLPARAATARRVRQPRARLTRSPGNDGRARPGVMRAPARGHGLAAVQHSRVADDVARRIVVVGADEAVAVQATTQGNVAVSQRAEHHLVDRRNRLLLQPVLHTTSLSRPCSRPRAERRQRLRRTALRPARDRAYAPE